MNLVKHFYKRWVERVVGIEDEVEANRYITENQEMIKEHAETMYLYATFMYKGQIGDHVTRNYYIKDNYILITNASDDAMITVFEVDYGFTGDVNDFIRKRTMEEIQALYAELEEAELEVAVTVDEANAKLLALDVEIEELKKRLEQAKSEHKFVLEGTKRLNEKPILINGQIRALSAKLIQSKYYLKDIAEDKKGS